MPIRILGFTAAGCYLLFLARDRLMDRRRLPAILLAAAGGLCLARLATFYVPWSLTIGLPLVLATGWFMVRERAERRVSLTTIGIGAAVAVVVLAGTLWENWSALQAELNTVYPGLRRVTGQPQPPFLLFGAPGLSELEDDPAPLLNNQSEISSAFLVCGVWAATLWSTARRTATRSQWAAVTGLAVLLVVTTSWTAVSVGRRRRARADAEHPAVDPGGADRRLPGRHPSLPGALTHRGGDGEVGEPRSGDLLRGHGVRRERSPTHPADARPAAGVGHGRGGHRPRLVRHPLAASGLARGRGLRHPPAGRVRRQPGGVRPG